MTCSGEMVFLEEASHAALAVVDMSLIHSASSAHFRGQGVKRKEGGVAGRTDAALYNDIFRIFRSGQIIGEHLCVVSPSVRPEPSSQGITRKEEEAMRTHNEDSPEMSLNTVALGSPTSSSSLSDMAQGVEAIMAI